MVRASAACPGGGWPGKRLRNSRANFWNGTVATAGRGFNTMSHPPGMADWLRRKASRKRRFTRLRSTALPRRNGAVMPRRVWDRPLGRKKIVPSGALRRCPSSYTRRNSPWRKSRRLLGKLWLANSILMESGGSALSAVGASTPDGPLGFSSAPGIHAFWPAVGGSVEKCVSSAFAPQSNSFLKTQAAKITRPLETSQARRPSMQ